MSSSYEGKVELKLSLSLNRIEGTASSILNPVVGFSHFLASVDIGCDIANTHRIFQNVD